MLPDVLRAEIQRAEAIALIKPLFAYCLQWAHGLHTIKKLLKLKAIWALTLTLGITPPLFFPLVKQQYQEPSKEMERYLGVVLFLIYLVSTLNCPKEHPLFNKSIQGFFCHKVMPVARMVLVMYCLYSSYIFNWKFTLYLSFADIAVLAKVWKKSPLEEKKANIPKSCKHDFVAFI